MINYNDGKWHGWNGGECPVHPETEVEYIYLDELPYLNKVDAEDLDWACSAGHLPLVAFRVVKEYKEPREFLLLVCTYSNLRMKLRSTWTTLGLKALRFVRCWNEYGMATY